MIRTVVVAVALMGAAACGGGNDDESNTPRITVDQGGSDESAVLLSTVDVKGIGGLEPLSARDLGELPFFENPDPRGPCGGVIPGSPLENAVGRAFTGESLVIVELVAAAPDPPNEYLRALIEDSRADDCGPYESETNTGATQQVRDVSLLDLHQVGDTAVGWTSTIEVQGQTIRGGAVAMERNGWFAFVQFQGVSLPPVDAITELAMLAAERLAR